MDLLKRAFPDIIAVFLFILISLAYFAPAEFQGRVLLQNDSVAGIGAGREAQEYLQKTGERTRWTNSIFGGMPTYQSAPSYHSSDTLRLLEKVYRLFIPGNAGLVFILLLGFYILLRAFNYSARLSAFGSIIWAFSSYFFIIIAAGHLWKFITLAYIPPTIAGMVWAYRGKYLLGGLVTALFVALQILSNHVQMTYYFLFVMLFMAIAYFADACRKKELPRFFKATGILAIAALIGASINLSNLYHTYQYSKETMRGKSELVKPKERQDDQTKSGLERSYITYWSYGIGETFSLLVPNVKGGASVPLSENKDAMEKANPTYNSLYRQIGQYWGEQPGTSGPVYAGAFVLMLFILGLFIVKGPMKWALLAATVLSILLSWGKNFMGFTDFFIDYVPLYDKFRAVTSILVIAEFAIPLLAVMALKEITDRPQMLKENLKYLYVSFGLTGGIALLFALAPEFFFRSYISSMEMKAFQNGLPAEHLAPFIDSLTRMRVNIFTADAWRSFFIIATGTLVLLAYHRGKLKAPWMIALIAALCLTDMWSVDKRYLYDSQFVEKNQYEISYKKTPADEFILRDKGLDYRVLNLASNTFNENNTSYWHKSIGGYHAAKLRRYQEMIDYHIGKEMDMLRKEVAKAGGDMARVDPQGFPAINMLNTKYFIFPGEGGKDIPVQNPYAFGNAWFVNKVKYVDNANEEIESIGKVNLEETAVVDAKFKGRLNGVQSAFKDSLSKITITAYEPNKLTYRTNNAKDGIAVFSEIYYPGWTATIDGKDAPIGRADYILRVMNIPAGEHTLVMNFDPKSLHTTEGIAYTGLILLIIGAIAVIAAEIKKR